MASGMGIFDILQTGIPSLGLDQQANAQQVGVDDLRQQLLDLLMNPQEPQQAAPIRPVQRTLGSIGDALGAYAAAMRGNPALNPQIIRRLEERRFREQGRLDQQGQQDQRRKLGALQLQLGAEQEGLARTQRGKEVAQAREDRIASSATATNAAIEAEARHAKRRAMEFDASNGFNAGITPEDTPEQAWSKVSAAAAGARVAAADQLTKEQEARLSEAEALMLDRLSELESSVEEIVREPDPEKIRTVFERRVRRVFREDPERIAAVMAEFESSVGAAIDAEIESRVESARKKKVRSDLTTSGLEVARTAAGVPLTQQEVIASMFGRVFGK